MYPPCTAYGRSAVLHRAFTIIIIIVSTCRQKSFARRGATTPAGFPFSFERFATTSTPPLPPPSSSPPVYGRPSDNREGTGGAGTCRHIWSGARVINCVYLRAAEVRVPKTTTPAAAVFIRRGVYTRTNKRTRPFLRFLRPSDDTAVIIRLLKRQLVKCNTYTRILYIIYDHSVDTLNATTTTTSTTLRDDDVDYCYNKFVSPSRPVGHREPPALPLAVSLDVLRGRPPPRPALNRPHVLPEPSVPVRRRDVYRVLFYTVSYRGGIRSRPTSCEMTIKKKNRPRTTAYPLPRRHRLRRQ